MTANKKNAVEPEQQQLLREQFLRYENRISQLEAHQHHLATKEDLMAAKAELHQRLGDESKWNRGHIWTIIIGLVALGGLVLGILNHN
ncbi:MAG: hypothetical protein F4112_10165 [Holophagales bacterium]|nr:hypothetical protein [Holophagales bacterium]MYD23842.1 hypothetical protein [Holophagales bacterium]MYI33325.1 hypothetical protein [Holophagales bacterium]